MQRDWKDPRDGTEWLVTLSPFGSKVPRSPDGPGERLTISFHRPGRSPYWTHYGLGRSVNRATDQEMMDLLDGARRDTRKRVGGIRHPGRTAQARTGA